MKRILFFVCCLTISMHIFSQSKFSKELFPTLAGLQRTSFHYYWTEDQKDSYSTLTMSTETVEVNGKQYMVFKHRYFLNLLLREEDNKVLIYSTEYEKDLVLYDWTLKEGDYLSHLSINPYFPLTTIGEYKIAAIIDDWNYFEIEDENGELIIKKEPLKKKKVQEVSTITLLDGKEYKMWKFDLNDCYIETLGWISSNDSRSGDYFRLIEEPDRCIPVCYMGEFLVCVSRDGQLLYKMDNETQHGFGSKCKCLNKGATAIYYNPMVVEGYSWNVVNRNAQLDGSNLVSYKTIKQKIEGDSVVNEVTYKKLWHSVDADLANYELIGLVREDAENEKVWALVGDKEYLIYDFACNVDDKVVMLKSLRSATAAVEEVEATITAIDEVEDANGKKYRKYVATLNDKSEIVYYERFGSENGWFSRSYDGAMGGGIDFMICAFDADNNLLFKPSFDNELSNIENCYIYETNTNVTDVEVEAGNIYYSSQEKTLYFDAENPTSVVIYDTMGKTIAKENVSAAANKISLNLNAGIYIVNIQCQNDRNVYSKIIVK